MANVSVSQRTGDIYDVVIDDGLGSTKHAVTVTPTDVERYASGATAEELLRASFDFLLEREPKEAILSRFELPVIERYFPEYPRLIGALVHQLRPS